MAYYKLVGTKAPRYRKDGSIALESTDDQSDALRRASVLAKKWGVFVHVRGGKNALAVFAPNGELIFRWKSLLAHKL